jgi:hypothetical protein
MTLGHEDNCVIAIRDVPDDANGSHIAQTSRIKVDFDAVIQGQEPGVRVSDFWPSPRCCESPPPSCMMRDCVPVS